MKILLNNRHKQIEAENNCKVLRVHHTDPLPIEIAAQIESACHKFFADFLAHDREFFNISFEDACAAIENFAEQSPKINFFPLQKYNELKFLIERCQDLNLRDELIKAAFKLLQ